MMKSKVLIITGGTGGHVIPALNFFNYLTNKSKNIFLLTDNRGYKYITNIDKTNILKIKSSHLSGNIYFKLLGIIKLLIGFLKCIIIFIKLRPKIIISFGSYASLAPLICFIMFKFFFKTKLYIHEQNSVMGQTNKFFSKFANKIFVNFNKDYSSIDKYKKKISIVGLPQNFNKKPLDKKVATSDLSFNFLVYAGSQGSLDIIIIFSKIFKRIIEKSSFNKIKFIIQCPTSKQKDICNLLNKNNCDFEIASFFQDFDKILCKSNLALCRGGAGTINDLIEFKIPAIICPLPNAKDNHQFENAKILRDIECAMIIEKNNIDFEKINYFIKKVINDKNFNKSLLDNFNKIDIKNANEIMWTKIKNG